MDTNVIIKGFSNVTKEGVALHLNEKTLLKKGGLIKCNEFWVSWDRIGEALFENYTNEDSVSARDELRKN